MIRRRASARRRGGRPVAVGICWTKAGVGALAKLRHHESLVEVAPRFSGRGPARRVPALTLAIRQRFAEATRAFSSVGKSARLITVRSLVRIQKGPLGDVAQLGEHLLCKQGVAGSSPAISTARCLFVISSPVG